MKRMQHWYLNYSECNF